MWAFLERFSKSLKEKNKERKVLPNVEPMNIWFGNILSSAAHKDLLDKHNIIVLSQDEVGHFKCQHPSQSVLIRIAAPGNKFPAINQGFAEVIESRFNDLSSALSERETKESASYNKILGEAMRLNTFIEKHIDKLIVVHCEMGKSRSAGVAAFILEVRGDDEGYEYLHSFQEHWDPNFWVITALRETREKR